MARNLTSIEEYHRLLAGASSEDDLLANVGMRLTLGRWTWHHIRRSDLALQMGDPGFPDIVAIRGDTLLALELKAPAGRYETGQLEWLKAFAAVKHVEVGLWRPGDIAEIERRLAP